MDLSDGWTGSPVGGNALALAAMPFAFTQDDLLTTQDFLRRAEGHGHRLSLEDLQRLHNQRLLVPLYRVSDTAVEGRRIAVTTSAAFGWNARRWVLDAAAEGRLRDAADEGYCAAWPYAKPADEGQHWWNGFVYSSWQLLLVPGALSRLKWAELGYALPDGRRFAEERRLVTALCALSTRYLPGVLQQLSLPLSDADTAALRRYRATVHTMDLLTQVAFDPVELAGHADHLLAQAHNDPLQAWLPLIRHSGYRQGWSKLRGLPLENMWRRAAAEVLLRAHEDLAAEGHLDPLQDLTGKAYWYAQHDRLSPRHKEAETLERALAELGLSPYPKVLLLVEGETELLLVPRLLSELGVRVPQDVRVQHAKGSRVNAHLITRYNIAPRIGRPIDKGWLLDASPTALMIAMDQENTFKTQEKRDKVRRDLQECIREEVAYQGAAIGQDVLDLLVTIRVWGEHSFELANFTDDELVPALKVIADQQAQSPEEASAWEAELREHLLYVRANRKDIKVALGRMRVVEDKVRLAELLWPVLRAKCERELAAGSLTTPVLKVALEARDLAARFTGVFALDRPEELPVVP